MNKHSLRTKEQTAIVAKVTKYNNCCFQLQDNSGAYAQALFINPWIHAYGQDQVLTLAQAQSYCDIQDSALTQAQAQAQDVGQVQSWALAQAQVQASYRLNED